MRSPDTGPNNNINKPQRPLAHLDPLLADNDGLPTTVIIPHHMGELVEETFNVDDPVFKELTVSIRGTKLTPL